MSVLLRRRELISKPLLFHVLFDNGKFGKYWTQGYTYGAGYYISVDSTLNLVSKSLSHSVGAYFNIPQNIDFANKINIKLSNSSMSGSISLRVSIVRKGHKAYLDKGYISSGMHRYLELVNGGSGTNGKTYSWSFKSSGSGLSYSGASDYYVCVFAAANGTVKIEKIWLE